MVEHQYLIALQKELPPARELYSLGIMSLLETKGLRSVIVGRQAGRTACVIGRVRKVFHLLFLFIRIDCVVWGCRCCCGAVRCWEDGDDEGTMGRRLDRRTETSATVITIYNFFTRLHNLISRLLSRHPKSCRRIQPKHLPFSAPTNVTLNR